MTTTPTVQTDLDTSGWLGPQPRHDLANPVKIDVEAVTLSRSGRQLLHETTFKIHAHEITGLVGAVGSGAKCLLHCFDRSIDRIPGMVQGGLIAIDCEDIRASYLAPAVLRRRVACLPANAAAAACRYRLDDWAQLLPDDLGRRVALASILASEPEIVLIDDPTDVGRTGEADDLIGRLDDLRSDFTIVLATNDIRRAARVCQRIVVFDAGRVVEKGDPEVLLADPHQAATRALVAAAAR